jgi:hypothetical protein
VTDDAQIAATLYPSMVNEPKPAEAKPAADEFAPLSAAETNFKNSIPIEQRSAALAAKIAAEAPPSITVPAEVLAYREQDEDRKGLHSATMHQPYLDHIKLDEGAFVAAGMDAKLMPAMQRELADIFIDAGAGPNDAREIIGHMREVGRATDEQIKREGRTGCAERRASPREPRSPRQADARSDGRGQSSGHGREDRAARNVATCAGAAQVIFALDQAVTVGVTRASYPLDPDTRSAARLAVAFEARAIEGHGRVTLILRAPGGYGARCTVDTSDLRHEPLVWPIAKPASGPLRLEFFVEPARRNGTLSMLVTARLVEREHEAAAA